MSITTENTSFQENELITISATISKSLYFQLAVLHAKELAKGTISVTLEQLIGHYIQTGISWYQYQELRKTFDK